MGEERKREAMGEGGEEGFSPRRRQRVGDEGEGGGEEEGREEGEEEGGDEGGEEGGEAASE